MPERSIDSTGKQVLDTQYLLQLLGKHVWDWNLVTNEMVVSPTLQEMLGYSRGEWRHHIDEWFGRIHSDETKMALAAMKTCIEGRSPHLIDEHRLRCRDGSWKWVRARGVVVSKNAQGKAVRMQGVITDITQQRERKEALIRSHVVLANLSKELPNVFFYQFQRFPGGRCCLPFASDAIKHVHGVRASEVRDNAAPLFATVHPDDVENLRDSMKASAQGIHVWHLDYRLKSNNGERHLFGEAYPSLQDDGSVLWHGFLVDVSERKSREKQVRNAEKQLHSAMKFVSLGMFDVNVQTGQGYFGEEYAEVMGLPQEYFVHTEKFWEFFWKESIHPEDVAALKATYQEHFKSHGEKPYRAEFRLRTKTGEWRWLLSVGSVVEWSQDGRALRMLGTHIDITERKKHELEVKHFEDILRSGRDRYKKLASELEILFSHTPIGILLVHNALIVRANPKLAQLFGYRDAKEMIGVSVIGMHESDASYQTFRATVGQRLNPDVAIEIKQKLKRKDGSFFEARLLGRVLPYEQFADTTVWMVEDLSK